MSLIATSIEPHRVTRIFLDCRDTPPDPGDLLRIEQALVASAALARSRGDALGQSEAIGGLTAPAKVLEGVLGPSEPAWPRRPSILTRSDNAECP